MLACRGMNAEWDLKTGFPEEGYTNHEEEKRRKIVTVKHREPGSSALLGHMLVIIHSGKEGYGVRQYFIMVFRLVMKVSIFPWKVPCHS